MEISVIVDDPAWSALDDPTALAQSACVAACTAANMADREFEVSIVLGSDDQVAALNQTWRNKAEPTNVLSFPATVPSGYPRDAIRPCGDIILAFGIVAAEAMSQSKSLNAHCSHLVIHGMLHLLGYDHDSDRTAEEMEAIEVTAMQHIELPNPYKEHAATGLSA